MSSSSFLLFATTSPAAMTEHTLLQGGFYGALAILGMYNLFLYGFTRSRGYLYYVAFIVSFLLYQLVRHGTALHYFWPEQLTLNNYAYALFFTLNTLAISFFVPSFLNLHEQNSNVFRLFRGYSALTLVSLLAFPLLNLNFVVPLYNSFGVFVTGSAFIVGLYFWLQGNLSARFFSLAWACYLIGWILSYWVDAQAYSFGALICIVLLGVALADRLTQKQQQDHSANLLLLSQQQHNISQLKEFEDLYQNSLLGQFQLDKEGYFVKTNEAWREILGYSSAVLFEKDNPHFDSLFAEHKQRRRFWRNLKEHGHLLTYLATFIQPTTQERIVVSLTVRQSNHEGFEWFGSGQDVSENFFKEQGLVQLQKEKAQSLRQLIAGLHQRIHVPIEKLTQAERYLHLDEAKLSDEAQQKVTQGVTLVKQGQEKLQNLSVLMQNSLVNSEDYPFEVIHIRPWFEHWQKQLQTRYETLQVRTAVHSYLVELPTYPLAMTLILQQLVESSLERNPELFAAEELKINVELRERGEFLELHYQDNGRVLQQEESELLFMPFTTECKIAASNQELGLYQTYNLLTELLLGVIEWPAEAENFHLLVRFSMPLPTEHA